MAFTQDTFASVGANSTDAPAIFSYDTTDTLATVGGALYFNDKLFQLEANDVILVNASDGFAIFQSDGAGAATSQVSGTQVINHKSSWIKNFTQGIYTGVYNSVDDEIDPMQITVTPQSSSSILMLEWVLFGESTTPENQLFVVKKNGTIMSGSEDTAAKPWSGVACTTYDNADNDTAQVTIVRFWDTAPDAGVSTTYDVCSRTSRTASNAVFYLGRCIGSTGASSFETGLSTAIVKEYL